MAGDTSREANADARRKADALAKDPGNKRLAKAALEAAKHAAVLDARAREKINAKGRKGSSRRSAAENEARAVRQAEENFRGFWSELLGRASKRAPESKSNPNTNTQADGRPWWA